MRFDVTVVVAAALGPFGVTVQGLGTTLTAAADNGHGRPDLAIAIRPPNGVGLSIYAPAVSGGGFLLFDPEAGRYAGVFELTLAGTVSVKAIGLITTKAAGRLARASRC